MTPATGMPVSDQSVSDQPVSSLAFGLAHLGHGLAWLPLVLKRWA